jgi:hypothetical protein
VAWKRTSANDSATMDNVKSHRTTTLDKVNVSVDRRISSRPENTNPMKIATIAIVAW